MNCTYSSHSPNIQGICILPILALEYYKNNDYFYCCAECTLKALNPLFGRIVIMEIGL